MAAQVSGDAAERQFQLVSPAAARQTKDELDPLLLQGSAFGNDRAAIDLQLVAIGGGGVRGTVHRQSFYPDAAGRTGVEDIYQREREQRGDDCEGQQAEA